MLANFVDSASQLLFGAAPQASAPAQGQAMQPEATLASGTPSPEAANALFGGMFDPIGPSVAKKVAEARKNLDAQLESGKELSGLLEVDGAGPNGVTPEQFQQLCELHAAIKQGKTDIKFDTGNLEPEKAKELKKKAMTDMAKMMQTESGREMLASLAHNENEKGEHKTTTLQFVGDPEQSNCTRKVSPDNDMEWENYRNDHNGKGNNAIVQYAPGQSFLQTGPDYEVQQNSDIVLFHEMAHAYHRTHGTLAGDEHVANPVHHLDQKIDKDEYQATGLGDYAGEFLTENQYRDERMQLGEEVGYRYRYSPTGKQLEN